ncbi:MAG: hypothetical protein ACLUHE_13560 [Christensenellales bacterium]
MPDCRSGSRRQCQQRIILQGDVPTPDRSAQRLPVPHALPLCDRTALRQEPAPELREVAPDRSVACHRIK